MVDYESLSLELRARGFDVNGIRDRLGKPIEPHIKPLVVALAYTGCSPQGSCEGHSLDEWEKRLSSSVEAGYIKFVSREPHLLRYEQKSLSGKPYVEFYDECPWVDFLQSSPSRLAKLDDVLRLHNTREGVHWGLVKFSIPQNQYRLKAVPRHDLAILQKDIVVMADDVLQYM